MAPSSMQARLDPWVDLVGDLLGSTWLPGWHRDVLPHLAETFEAAASWNWSRPDGSYGFEAIGVPPSWPGPSDIESWQAEVRARHPLLRWYATTGDPTPLSMARVPSSVSPRRDLEAVRDLLAGAGIEEQLSIPLFLRGQQHLAFVMARADEDFPDEDVELARRLQLLLRLLERQARVLADVVPEGPVAEIGLTSRELAVLAQVARGVTARVAAHRLGISERTVHKHLENAYRKLGVRDRVSAVATAAAAGLLRTERGELRAAPRGPVEVVSFSDGG